MSARRVVVAVLVALAGARVARAEPKSVAVIIDPCVGTDETIGALRRAIELELSPSAVDAVAPAAVIEIACAGEQRLIRIEDRLTSKQVSRVISLAGQPALGHPRFLGLAAVELLLASWLELAALPAGGQAERQSAAAARGLATRLLERRRRTRTFTAFASALARYHEASTTRGVGAGLRVGARNYVEAALALERGEELFALGRVDGDMVTGAVHVGRVLHGTSATVVVGAGVRGGAVRWVGRPNPGSSGQVTASRATHPWLAASGSARLGVGAEALRLSIGVELGVAVVESAARVLNREVRWGGPYGTGDVRAELAW